MIAAWSVLRMHDLHTAVVSLGNPPVWIDGLFCLSHASQCRTTNWRHVFSHQHCSLAGSCFFPGLISNLPHMELALLTTLFVVMLELTEEERWTDTPKLQSGSSPLVFKFWLFCLLCCWELVSPKEDSKDGDIHQVHFVLALLEQLTWLMSWSKLLFYPGGKYLSFIIFPIISTAT